MEEQKVCPSLLTKLKTAPRMERLPVIITFKDEAKSLRMLRQFSAELPVRRTFDLIPAVSLTASPAEIGALTRDPRIATIWWDSPVHICLDTSAAIIRAPEVWESGYSGKGIRVAVLDTGLDMNHPDLIGRVLTTRGFSGEGFKDNNGHGTHVAGIIAGNGMASGGRYRGIAPGVLLLAAKVLKGDGSGLTSDVMAGVEWAVRQGVRLINLSLGTGGRGDGNDPLSLFCDAAVERGVVVCAAAGNDGPAAGTISAPAAAKRVLAVGAVTRADTVAEFSARGPTADGRVKPDILAPGQGIVSCRAEGTAMGQAIDEDYTSASGTSMATAFLSGAVAILLEANPRLSAEEVREILQRTAKDLSLAPNVQGAGRLDLLSAYKAARGDRVSWTPPGCLFPFTIFFPLKRSEL
ncbi:MAG: S8 family peptidase [Chloroflexi bacterium]|nr:S8 family peptidase [Chloroflexota bacterium]